MKKDKRVEKGLRWCRGSKCTTYKRVFGYPFALVEAGTTGYKGGDAGHGSRALFLLENTGGNVRIAVEDSEGRVHTFDFPQSVRITVSGDMEIRQLLESLSFAVAVLKAELEKGE